MKTDNIKQSHRQGRQSLLTDSSNKVLPFNVTARGRSNGKHIPADHSTPVIRSVSFIPTDVVLTESDCRLLLTMLENSPPALQGIIVKGLLS